MLRLDRAEALRFLGYAGQDMDPELERRFDAAVAACESDAVPRWTCASFALDAARSNGTRIALAGGAPDLEGRDIVRHLDGVCEAVLLACTLGAANERELRKRSAVSPTDALLYSAASSALVEAAADRAEADIVAQAAARGLRTSFRYSPGYGDFPLDVQRAFLSALDAPLRIGLSATAESLLVPVKSVTAVIGLFEGEPPRASVRSSCASCSLRDHCALKPQGRTCHG